MRFEFSTTYFMDLPLEDAVKECLAFGFNNLQLGAAHLKADVRKVLELKKRYNLNFSLHAPVPSPMNEINSKTLSFFLKSLDNARVLNANPVILHPPDDLRMIPLIREFCVKALSLGLTVCLENKGFDQVNVNTPVKVLSIIRELSLPNVFLCFDTNHLFGLLDSEEAVFDSLVKHYDFVRAVHLVRMSGCLIEHEPPVRTPFMTKIIRFLRDFSGPVTFEVVPPITREQILASKDYIHEVLNGF